jgi:hypothetical protein
MVPDHERGLDRSLSPFAGGASVLPPLTLANSVGSSGMSYRISLALLWLVGFAAASTVMLTACTTLQVGSDYDKSAVFSGYHTFTIMQREHRGVHNPLVVTRTDDAIRQTLIDKGYSPAPDPAAADFTVDFTIGSKERTDINSYPTPYGGPGWGWGGGPGWWGGPYWGNELDVRQYREGTLSVDVFDAKTHRPVWHGWAKKELTRKDLEQSEQPIKEAVAAVLAKFPPS